MPAPSEAPKRLDRPHSLTVRHRHNFEPANVEEFFEVGSANLPLPPFDDATRTQRASPPK